jgi:hypothetical protein
MDDKPKPLSRGVLLGELIGGLAFAICLAAYYSSLPPTVNLGMSLAAAVASRLILFVLCLTVLTLGLRARSRIARTVLLVGAGVLFLLLLVVSFPQY